MNFQHQAARELPRYRSHKEVWALKIKEVLTTDLPWSERATAAMLVPSDSRYAPFPVDAKYMGKHKPQPGGYYVLYADGYESFSPAQAFESGYTLIETK